MSMSINSNRWSKPFGELGELTSVVVSPIMTEEVPFLPFKSSLTVSTSFHLKEACSSPSPSSSCQPAGFELREET
jgi:hypothetical protein